MEDKPYIEVTKIVTEYKYNPNYGDHLDCRYGHPYHRHFDSHDDMEPCGCKYCHCREFKEVKENG